MKIVTIVGARPQFIKAATLSRVIKNVDEISEIIVHTGQHYDPSMSDVFFKELNIPQPDINLEVGSGSHAKQTAKMLEGIEEVLLQHKPDCVVVYGDTNSTIAGALAASKLHIPIVHVEAGLRSFNRAMPEEINRIATDHISDCLFAPTQNAMELLEKEGLAHRSVFSGDVMFDSILYYKEIARKKHKLSDIVDAQPGQYYLATVHRQENTDNIRNLQSIFLAFSELDLPVIIPLHPRTLKVMDEISYRSNVKVISPVGYLEMITLLANSCKVLTDSGGLQKEAYFMQKPCITLREETEWIETLEGNWNFIVSTNREKILEKINVNDFAPQKEAFGNGKAAELIVEHLLKNYN
ncbi:MAG TPA: UDP-N-acetylglucosamine 2-epimerase (non-hydrolyzing) [Bacteroidales bacterium]|nr:UDP-N-acetylglucosamine 2-epimerase (non-hydrolyzing) [Bacteroidales bacterium]